MPDLEKLRDLEKRLVEAEGASRELDEEIHAMRPESKVIEPPRYTTSIDSALALIEEKLPGWDWTVGTWGAEAGPYGVVQKRGTSTSFAAIAETPALGCCLALVRALIAQEEGRG